MPRAAAPPDVPGAILDAAMRLMEWYGYRKMTMDDIAREAQIGKATIYGYFQNKEDVALSVIDRKRRALLARCEAVRSSEGTPEQRLRSVLEDVVLYAFDSAQRYRISLDDALASLRTVVLARREVWNAELAEVISALLEDGCSHGSFQCADCSSTARTIITCLGGLSPSNLSPRELGSREEIVARTDAVIDLMLAGLAVRR